MEKKELNYIVRVSRKDGVFVDLVETNDFSKARQIWEDSYINWKTVVENKEPFVVSEPADNSCMTAFDPSLINEILIIPLEVQKAKSSNPYSRRMQSEGFSSVFPGGSDLVDGGYR